MSVYLLIVYVPVGSGAELKSALFAAGAGKIANYDRCCWQVGGQGQFRPLDGAQPHLGRVGEVETVAELRLEMMVDQKNRAAVQEALQRAHPYETPACFWVPLANEESQ